MTKFFISIAIIIILIIYNIISSKKNVYKSYLYKKINKLKILSYLTSIVTFIIFLIINLISVGTNPSTQEILTSIINALSISLLTIPISINSLYHKNFNEEEKYTHIKTIVTNKYNKEIFDKLNKADINVILLSDKKTNLTKITEENITSNILKKTIQIDTSNLKILDKKINKENTIKEFKDISDLYIKIENARNIHDNYIKGIKHAMFTYIPIILSYILLLLVGFPVKYDILLISILKLYTTIKVNYLYKTLPYEEDIMTRTVKPSNIIFGKQELLLLIMEIFIIAFGLTVPYMYVLASGGSITLAYTIFLVTFIITNTLHTYYELSDSSFLKNIFKYLKHIKIHLFTLISIVMILIFNYTKFFNTMNITLHNNIGALIISLFILFVLEMPKLARFTSKKGKKKHATKNNKK